MGGTHIIAEDEKRRAVRDQTPMKRHAVQNGSHRVLPYAEAQVSAIGESHSKSPSFPISVFLLGARSADPPISSGTCLAMALRAFPKRPELPEARPRARIPANHGPNPAAIAAGRPLEFYRHFRELLRIVFQKRFPFALALFAPSDRLAEVREGFVRNVKGRFQGPTRFCLVKRASSSPAVRREPRRYPVCAGFRTRCGSAHQ